MMSSEGNVAQALSRLSGTRHALTIGNFDGVHRGHRYLLEQVKQTAAQRDVPSLVLTFEPHPIAVLRPGQAPPRISTPEDKVALLRRSGIDEVAVIPFDLEFAALEADEFLQLINDAASPTDVFVGDGFRFGKMRSGDINTLTSFGTRHGFTTHVVSPLVDDVGVVSSSRVRAALLDGLVEDAAVLLGRRFRLCGAVEHGMARGRDLGYPTANLAIASGLCIPGDGIYAGYAHLDDRRAEPREALVYIGSSPTFGERERLVEVNILDYRGDLYSQELEIEFLAFVRPDQVFDNANALMHQMTVDEQQAREVLARSRPEKMVRGDS